jgi:hypothetical protein
MELRGVIRRSREEACLTRHAAAKTSDYGQSPFAGSIKPCRSEAWVVSRSAAKNAAETMGAAAKPVRFSGPIAIRCDQPDSTGA